MKNFPENIPEDIKNIIYEIDVKQNEILRPDPSWNIEKYSEEINQLFGQYIISNDTSFDYSRSYIYAIYKTTNLDVLKYDKNIDAVIAQSENGLESFGISISAVSKYLLLTFALHGKNAVDAKLSYDPITPWHYEVKAMALDYFSKLKFKIISKDLAFMELPEIATSATDFGETRVQDCLF